ncbi:hypothetical protein ACIQPR_15285 [Streptomyces sp. NPDC091280]|uniref:hypothetical protein n=1 Tax=Streptomyces sp. NPDC091280 TaxID=3365984 RepID=UPI003823FCDD
MREHRELLRPKFDTVLRILTDRLADTGLATWSAPRGGYFITLDVLDGCAREVVCRAADAGLALTPAGAAHPYGDDPGDRTIRIAPSFPDASEIAEIIDGVATCVRLVGYEKLVADAS